MNFINKTVSPFRYLLGFGLIALSGLPLIAMLALTFPFRATRIRLGNRWGRLVGPILLKIASVKVKIKGIEILRSQGQAIYLSNHSSELDPLIAISYCPVGGCGVAKKSIVLVPFFGQIYWLSGHLRIDRKNRKRAIESMRNCTQLVLRQKLSIWIWPEGSRSKTGELQPFKKGFAHMALESKLPIVPIVVKGAYQLWPPKSWVITPGGIQIEVLPPIETDSWRAESIDKHIADVEMAYSKAISAASE